jgi:hypothetical protein
LLTEAIKNKMKFESWLVFIKFEEGGRICL